MKLARPIAVYEKASEITVKKIRHRINFHLKGDMLSLLNSMSSIPKDCTICDFGDYEDDANWGYIEFSEELKCK